MTAAQSSNSIFNIAYPPVAESISQIRRLLAESFIISKGAYTESISIGPELTRISFTIVCQCKRTIAAYGFRAAGYGAGRYSRISSM